jgi:hypothetical protein
MARWMTEQPKLIVTPPAPAKIGGLEGTMVTVTMVAGAENSCPVPGTGNMVPLLMAKPDWGLAHPIVPGLAMRLYLLKSEGGVLAIEVDDVTGGGHLDDYDSVVHSMQFKLRRESPLGGS